MSETQTSVLEKMVGVPPVQEVSGKDLVDLPGNQSEEHKEKNFNRREAQDHDWKSLGKLVRTTPFNHNSSTYLWVETNKCCFAVSLPLGKTIWAKTEVTQHKKDLKRVRFGKLELSMFIPKVGGNH